MKPNNSNTILIENLAIQITSAKLNGVVNSQIKSVFQKRGPVTLNIKGNEVLLILKPEVQIGLEEKMLKGKLPVLVETNIKLPVGQVNVKADLLVDFSTEVHLEPGNKIRTSTQLKDVHWISGPDISPPLIDFIVPDNMVRSFIDDSLPEIGLRIDESMADVVDIGRILKYTVWQKLLELPLKNSQKAYLLVAPSTIELYSLQVNKQILKLTINSHVMVKWVDPDVRIDTKYIPELKFIPGLPSGKTTDIVTRLILEDMEKPALKIIKSMGSVESAIRCTIEKILIRTVEDDGLAIALKLKGALNGGLSIGGRPVIQTSTLELDMNDLTFKFSGKGIVSSLTGNIALSLAKSTIRKQFPLQLKTYVENLVFQINKMISDLRLSNHIVLKGKTENWKINSLEIHDGTIMLHTSSYMVLEIH